MSAFPYTYRRTDARTQAPPPPNFNFCRALQIDKGFMRAGVYAAMGANCSRVLMYKLGLTKAGHEVLDVGIYQNRHWKVKVQTVGDAACGLWPWPWLRRTRQGGGVKEAQQRLSGG